MSAVATLPRRTGAVSAPAPLTPAARLTGHLRPAFALRRYAAVLSDRRFVGAPLCDPEEDLTPQRAAKLRDRALDVVETIPTMTILVAMRDLFELAADGRKATTEQIVAIVSAMLDGRPNFDPARRAGYVDMLLEILRIETGLERFTAAALATAAYRSLTTQRFAPGADELLALVTEVRSDFRGAKHDAMRLFDHRDAAEVVLVETDDLDASRAGPVPFGVRHALR